MQKSKSVLFFILLLICTSCDSDKSDYEPSPPSINQDENSKKTPLVFYDSFTNKSANYNAVRIGEYLWMDSNINHYEGTYISRDAFDRGLTIYRLDPTLYKVSIENIKKHYGPYYDRARFEYLEDKTKCIIYEGKDKVFQSGWGAPSIADSRQLFAMCGNGSEEDVRAALACKPGDNPAVISGFTHWFSPLNTNKYGFNLMPDGARVNGDQDTPWRLCYHSVNDCVDIWLKKGDFYGLAQMATWVATDGTIMIHDYPEGNSTKLWHWLPVRWCRKLTDKELGYKLYINQGQTDIIKLSLTDSAPAGYTELPNGYIRGFYVQFILNNNNPYMDVPKIIEMAKNLR